MYLQFLVFITACTEYKVLWRVNSIYNVCFVCWWCLTPLSTIFQLYHGSQFFCGGNQRTLRNPQTYLKLITNKLDHKMLYTSPWSRFELTTSVVIGTDCIGSCKSNYMYHTITAMMPPSPHIQCINEEEEINYKSKSL